MVPRSRRQGRGLAALVTMLGLLLCVAPAQAAVRPLPAGTDVDYQLGGPRSVPANVGIVVRDRSARPLPGKYNVCYVNGFQSQPDEKSFWKKRSSLLLHRHGRLVVDEVWGEWLLDIRTQAKRTRITTIVGRWIDRCARDGFDAVEFDNLDSFGRSHGLIRPGANRALAKALVARAHRAGLAAGQKNYPEWNGRRVGFDFAIAEECARWHECGSYVRHYGDRVLDIEYRVADFEVACRTWGARLAVVRRDLDLSPAGPRRWC